MKNQQNANVYPSILFNLRVKLPNYLPDSNGADKKKLLPKIESKNGNVSTTQSQFRETSPKRRLPTNKANSIIQNRTFSKPYN